MKLRLINKSTGEPLKVVDHIGCHYAKIFPNEGIGGAEYPYVMAGLIDEWGGPQVDYPELLSSKIQALTFKGGIILPLQKI